MRKSNEKNLINHPGETSLFAKSSPSACSMKEEDQSPNINASSYPDHIAVASVVNPESGWNLSTGYLRPQLFCLEHAIETVELLRPKGGANVLGICHSGNDRLMIFQLIIIINMHEIYRPYLSTAPNIRSHPNRRCHFPLLHLLQ